MLFSCIGKRNLKIIPVRIAEKICTVKSRIPVFGELKNALPTVARINAGPQLLQKARARSASFFEQYFLSYAAIIVAAPTGYPPIKPSMSDEESVPPREKQGRIMRYRVFPKKSKSFIFIIRLAEIRKGKREGITEVKHKLRESLTALLIWDGYNKRPIV